MEHDELKCISHPAWLKLLREWPVYSRGTFMEKYPGDFIKPNL